jgi:hypothetical protein
LDVGIPPELVVVRKEFYDAQSFNLTVLYEVDDVFVLMLVHFNMIYGDHDYS